MHPFSTPDPTTLTMDVLFPEQFEASKNMIIRDFAFFGVTITTVIVAIVALAA